MAGWWFWAMRVTVGGDDAWCRRRCIELVDSERDGKVRRGYGGGDGRRQNNGRGREACVRGGIVGWVCCNDGHFLYFPGGWRKRKEVVAVVVTSLWGGE
jgi:hypothetical protein